MAQSHIKPIELLYNKEIVSNDVTQMNKSYALRFGCIKQT